MRHKHIKIDCGPPPIAKSSSTLRSSWFLVIGSEEKKLQRLVLHDHTAATRLLRRIRVLALGDGAPDGGNHVVPSAIAVSNDAVARLVTAHAPISFWHLHTSLMLC